MLSSGRTIVTIIAAAFLPPGGPPPFGQAPFLSGRRTALWVASLSLIGVLLLGAAVLAWLSRWRKRAVSDKTSAGDQLAHFRTLYERGELSPAEFARVRALLGERLKEELDVPTLTPINDKGKEPKPDGQANGRPPTPPPDAPGP